MIKTTPENLKRQLEKQYKQDDWHRDITWYVRWRDIGDTYDSEYAAIRMAQIKAKWPGKEKYFD